MIIQGFWTHKSLQHCNQGNYCNHGNEPSIQMPHLRFQLVPSNFDLTSHFHFLELFSLFSPCWWCILDETTECQNGHFSVIDFFFSVKIFALACISFFFKIVFLEWLPVWNIQWKKAEKQERLTGRKRWLLCAEIFVLNWEMIECTASTLHWSQTVTQAAY